MFMTFECYGQWSKSTLINTPVCIGYNADQSNLVQNGSLGTYVVWLDSRIGHVYAQYVNAKGVAQWKTNGIFICGQQGNQTAVHAINDGLGNFIITWYNSRDTVFDFYAQKITPEGIICWPTGGIKFASSKATLSTYNISSDSRGGVVIAYLSYIWPTYSPPYSLLVQRIDKNGSICWGNGKTIVDASYLQEAQPVLIPDGLKGVVLA